MAGANVAMLASELIAHGIERLSAILADLQVWMEEYAYESIEQMRKEFEKRMHHMHARLSSLPKVICVKPQGAWAANR